MAQKEKNRKSARLLTKVALVAVIGALLFTTAYAAPAILRAIRGSSLEYESGGWMAVTGAEEEGPYDKYDLYLTFDMDPNAPDTINVHYLPQLPQGYVQYFGHDWKELSALFMWTNGEKNWHDEVRFWQHAGKQFAEEPYYRPLFHQEGIVPQKEQVTLGGVEGCLVDGDSSYGSHLFYWTDGEYLFELEVPDEYTREQIGQLVASLKPVEDIKAYFKG